MNDMKFTYILGLILATSFLLSCNTSKNANANSDAMSGQKDSISYAYGLNLANQFAAQGIEINPEAYREGLSQAMDGVETVLNEAEVRNMIVMLQNEIRAKQVARQSRGYFQPGSPAPEISLPNPEGQVVSLSSLKGKYVLVDFWASWCKPCRAENPTVVRVYNEFKNKGFEILGVSLDRNRDAWLGAIAQDQLQWLHVSDLQFWNSAAAHSYGVISIPYTVLVDPLGNFFAEIFRGPSLEAKLREIFKG